MPIRKAVRTSLRLKPPESCISRDKVVVFFPTAAAMEKGVWRVPVHGWIYQPSEFSRLRRLGLALSGLVLRKHLPRDGPEVHLFKQRAGAFFAENKAGRNVFIQVGSQVVKLKR